MGLLGSIGGFIGAGGASGDLKDLAKENREAVEKANAANMAWAQKLLAMSHPDIGATDLGNLLFSQGEQEATHQHDQDLATVLRQNLRSGSPLSISDVMGGFDKANSGMWADRRTNATLQGLTGVLPSSAAIQTAGNLGRNMPATMDPQLMSQSIMLDRSKWSTLLSSLDDPLQAMFSGGGTGGGQATTGQPGNTGTGASNGINWANIIGLLL